MDNKKLKQESKKKLQQIEKELTKSGLVSNGQKMAVLGKEQIKLKGLLEKIKKADNLHDKIRQTEKMVKEETDEQLKVMAEEELLALSKEQKLLLDEIKQLSSPPDPNDEKNAILEIRSGTGGDEAELFAADLFRMYSRFAQIKSYKVEITSKSKTSIGGIKEVITKPF